jgi:alpha-tubulin suppressor-like RCC1 family protein
MDNAKAISTGYYHSLIIKADDIFWGAGDSGSEQLGDGTNDDRTLFVRMNL